MTRKVTTEVIEAAEELPSFWETVARACLAYLSEDEVVSIAHEHGWLERDDEEE